MTTYSLKHVSRMPVFTAALSKDDAISSNEKDNNDDHFTKQNSSQSSPAYKDKLYNSELVEEMDKDGNIHVSLKKTATQEIDNHIHPNGSLEIYYEQIKKFPLLTLEEELELGERVKKTQDEEALQKLITSNLRFVVKVAKSFMGSGLPLPDLIEEGNLGLIKAAMNYDYEEGNKLISYAVWQIEASIKEALKNTARTVRLPGNAHTMINKIKKATAELTESLGRTPTIDEIAETLDIPEKKLKAMLIASKYSISLDSPIAPGDNSKKVIDFIASKPTNPEYEIDDKQERRIAYLKAMLETLSPMEKEVITLRLGLGNDIPRSIGEIALKFGTTYEEVESIQKQAVKQLKKLCKNKI